MRYRIKTLAESALITERHIGDIREQYVHDDGGAGACNQRHCSQFDHEYGRHHHMDD